MPNPVESTAVGEAVGKARFDLERANRACYYAANYAREHRGEPEAWQDLEAAFVRREQAAQSLREAERRWEEVRP